MINKIEDFLLALLSVGLFAEMCIAPILLSIAASMIELEFMKYLLICIAVFSVIVNIIIVIFTCIMGLSTIDDSNDVNELEKAEESK